MTFTAENILLIGSVLLFISVIASKTSFRFGIPTLILFLLVGMLAGSDGPGGIYFDDPKMAQIIGIIALNFILFSGGLDTKWGSVKPVLGRGIVLSTVGVLLTALSVGVFVMLISDFSLLEGILLGSIVSSTDAAAVFSILRGKSIGLKGYLRPTLELESGSNDPMAYFLTISLTSLVTGEASSIGLLIPLFFMQMIFGGAAGLLLGRFMLRLINRINLESDGLYTVLMISFMFFTYSFTDTIGGNGFLAVYIAGIILGNRNFIHKRSIIKFFDGLAWLMQIIMFLTLGLLVYPSHLIDPLNIGMGLLISLFLIFVARPIGVFTSLAFFKMSNRKRMFISWVGLRGAVPIVFATYPLIAGVEKAQMIFNLVFFIAVSSVLVQGTSLPIVAKWLHLTVPEKIRRRSILDLEMAEGAKSELEEIELDINSSAIGKPIVDIGFPKTALIVLISRNGNYITPTGSTILEEGDNLLIMSDNKKALAEVYDLLGVEQED